MSAAPQRPHRVCVAGASGRMGQMLVEAVRDSGDCVLAGALDVSTSAEIGQDAGAFAGQSSGVIITADVAEPGTPKASMGKIAQVPAAWSAVSGATTPAGSPFPYFSGFFEKRRASP